MDTLHDKDKTEHRVTAKSTEDETKIQSSTTTKTSS
jgi:hypothetical protein